MKRNKKKEFSKVGSVTVASIAVASILWILASVIQIKKDMDVCKHKGLPYTFSDAWGTIVDNFLAMFVIALIVWSVMKIVYDVFFAPSEGIHIHSDKD